MGIVKGERVADQDLMEYIQRLPNDDVVAEEQRIVKLEARKRKDSIASQQRTSQTPDQVADDDENDAEEEIASSTQKLKRRSVVKKQGSKPKPKQRVEQPTIIDRLAPFNRSEPMPAPSFQGLNVIPRRNVNETSTDDV